MAEKESVEKIVRSLISGCIKTKVELYAVETEEVLIIKFGSEKEYERLLKVSAFVSATHEELLDWVNRSIPIIQDKEVVSPPVDTSAALIKPGSIKSTTKRVTSVKSGFLAATLEPVKELSEEIPIAEQEKKPVLNQVRRKK